MPGRHLRGARRPSRRGLAVLATAVLGLVLVVAAGTALLTARRLPATFGDVTAGAALTTSASPAGSPGSATVPRASPAASVASAPATSVAPPATTAPPPPPAPVVLTAPDQMDLGAFDVHAPVVPVLTDGSRLTPPDDPGTVGWWIASAPAGSTSGSTVLVGHVDGPKGPGALYRLVDAHAGDPIDVVGPDGATVHYTITALDVHRKGSALPAALFAQTGAPRLVVVSCGGPFDRSTDNYEDNIVVTATPVAG